MPYRKHITAPYRAQIIEEIKKEEKNIYQIAFEYGVRPTQLIKWRDMTSENLPNSSHDDKKIIQIKSNYEQKIYELSAEIERLKEQLKTNQGKQSQQEFKLLNDRIFLNGKARRRNSH